MVGIIVMTHGTLSEGIVDAAELITGPVTQVETLSLRREDNVNDLNAAFSPRLTAWTPVMASSCWPTFLAEARATSRA